MTIIIVWIALRRWINGENVELDGLRKLLFLKKVFVISVVVFVISVVLGQYLGLDRHYIMLYVLSYYYYYFLSIKWGEVESIYIRKADVLSTISNFSQLLCDLADLNWCIGSARLHQTLTEFCFLILFLTFHVKSLNSTHR